MCSFANSSFFFKSANTFMQLKSSHVCFILTVLLFDISPKFPNIRCTNLMCLSQHRWYCRFHHHLVQMFPLLMMPFLALDLLQPTLPVLFSNHIKSWFYTLFHWNHSIESRIVQTNGMRAVFPCVLRFAWFSTKLWTFDDAACEAFWLNPLKIDECSDVSSIDSSSSDYYEKTRNNFKNIDK